MIKINKVNIKELNKRLLEISKQISGFYNKIFLSVFVFQVILYIAYFSFRKSSLILTVSLMLIMVISWAASKDYISEEKQSIAFLKVKTSFLFFTLMLVNHIVFFLNKNFKTINTNTNVNIIQGIQGIQSNFNGFLIIPISLNLIVFFMYLFISRLDEVKEFEETLKNTSFLEKLKNDSEDLNSGDILICRDVKTNKMIRLPYTDRFLHMLVIGPTGCGKTSQIIIPMLLQDIKDNTNGITVIEPKGDLANKVYAMAQYYGRPAIYFNPELDACPSFNPLFGKEEDVIENIVTTFKMLDPDAKQYFQDMNEQLLRNALKILKRFKGNKATLLDLNTLISNPAGEGRLTVNKFMKLPAKNEAEQKENLDCASYFLDNYFNEKSKTYENCSGVRSQVYKITSNKFLRKVLNPENGKSDLDFEKHLEEGGVLCITTAQGKLRDLGSFLGYFIILNFQSAVFKRPGNEDSRRAHFLYIDEFQKYSNPGFADMLTQGRSYRVASHLATQARAQIGMGSGKDGNAFINLVSTNCRNVVVFPGVSYDDAKFYSDQFGQDLNKKIRKSKSQKQFNPAYGFERIGYANVSESTEEKLEARFTPTDIIYRKKKEITFAYVKEMVVQVPVAGKIDYIPWKLNQRLNQMVYENEYLMKFNQNPNNCRDFSKDGCPLLPEWEQRMPEVIKEIDRKEAEDKLYDEDIAEMNKNKDKNVNMNDDFDFVDIMDFVKISENPDEYNKNSFNDDVKIESGIDISEDDLKALNKEVSDVVIMSSNDDDDMI